MLTVQETHASRVELALDVLLRGSMIVAGILTVVSILLLLFSFGSLDYLIYWIYASLVLLAVLFGLDRLRQRGNISVVVNLFLAAITLYTSLANLQELPMVGLSLLLYAVPIATAALLLTPAAGLVWGGIVTAVVLIRALVVGMLFLHQTPDSVLILLSILGLGIIASICWLLSRSFQELEWTLRRQIRQGQAGIEIGHTITAALDPPSIIRQAVQLVQEAFGYYHVGLFVVDPRGELAVLVDAAGEAASSLKERGFVTSLSGTTAVAAAISQQRQRVVVSWEESRDQRGRPIQFTYERLPTRAELVIPLQVRERVLGALDVHSTGMDPFPEEDVHALVGLAGHIANALEGARLLDDIQRRHQELTTVYAQTERRARYMQTTAELARAVSSLTDPQELLSRAVVLVQGSLPDLYHAGIFLIDEAGEWAVLMAASSEGGQRMLARGHRLRVGEQGIVGWVAQAGQPRIALDVGEDAVYFDNPDLPDTRSELALPLKVGEQVIGALDVQSMRETAFSEEDTAVLQTLTDQIAIAIQNARLFQQTQRALEEVQALQRYYVAQQWGRLTRQRTDLKAEYRSLGVPSLDVAWTSEMEMALTQESPVILSDMNAPLPGGDGGGKDEEGEQPALSARAAMAIPIRLGGEVIGVLDVQEADQPRRWTEEEVAIATAVADQLALAVENARLFEETQRRAAQLAAASEVARDATAILDVEQLLDETVHLISERFGFYHAGVFLLDERNEYAVLQAASSDGGRRMLKRGHRLRVGKVGIVGRVAATGESRVVLDVARDADFAHNPDLPDTRSELALPLKVQNRAIGVLDVQSTQEATFSEEDVAVLQTMADQLATAIANARLFREVRADAMRRALINEVTQAATSSLNVSELLDRAAEAVSRRLEMPCAIFEWDAEAEALRAVTIRDSGGYAVPLPQPLLITAGMDPMMFQAIRTRQQQVLFDVPTQASGVATQMAQQAGIVDAAYVPLLSRDQTLGLLVLGRQEGHPPLDEGELSFAEIVAANLSVAIENARLYQEAVRTAERLAEVDRLKSQFLANMSHELRTPLNSIIGFSRVILKEIDGPLTDMQRTDLQTVYDSGQHLLNLINDILDLSKIEAGKMEVAFEDVDLREVIKSVMSSAIGLVKDKPIELQQPTDPDLPTVRADLRRIRQVVINLISNAAKFTEQGIIRVEAKASPTEVIVSVTDSGIGIPPEKLGAIFQPFTQVDASTTRRAGGTGLGLSICKSFIELHGGRIWVESTLGVGSTFYFTLPIQGPPPQELEEAAEEVQTPEKEPVESKKEAERVVLCVEDDEGVITLFRRYLSKQGYRVVGLTDSKRVMEEAKRLRPYAITLDVMMPDRDGWQVIQELKADAETSHIPVVMCTIISEKGRGMSLGAADYLVKPVLEQDLLAALDHLDREEGRHRVLVVDDHPHDRELLRRMIESQDGYEVIEAASGPEAIALVEQKEPHIIILDLMMPEMDGFAVLEAIKSKEATRSIPIIVVTAKDLTEEDRKLLNHNVASLIRKGLLKREELLEDVAAALARLGRHLPQ